MWCLVIAPSNFSEKGGVLFSLSTLGARARHPHRHRAFPRPHRPAMLLALVLGVFVCRFVAVWTRSRKHKHEHGTRRPGKGIKTRETERHNDKCVVYMQSAVGGAVDVPFGSYDSALLHGLCLTEAILRVTGEAGLHRRSTVHRRSLSEEQGRFQELCCRARSRLPSDTLPAQHMSSHLLG